MFNFYRHYDADFGKLIKKYIPDDLFINATKDSDNGKLIAEGLAERDSLYTALLKNYVSLTKLRNILKEIHKWLFFWFVVVLSGYSCYVLAYYIKNSINFLDIQTNTNTVPLIVAFASLVSTVISIPLIIAKYLFNNNEDNNITTIIAKTEEHDNAEIQLLKERFTKEFGIKDVDSDDSVKKSQVPNLKDINTIQELLKKSDN